MVCSLLGGDIHRDVETVALAEEVVEHLCKRVRECARRPETRASLSMLPAADVATRLAELDVESCGWAKVHAQGTRDQPSYTDLVAVPLTTELSLRHRLEIEEKFHELTPGGHLALIPLADSEIDADNLLSTTKGIMGRHKLGLYAFTKHLAYCANCKKTFYGILEKCPGCGSVNMLVCFDRISAKHKPSSLWSPSQRVALKNRVPYLLNSN
jgi:ribonucleoside-triphosphate reductase